MHKENTIKERAINERNKKNDSIRKDREAISDNTNFTGDGGKKGMLKKGMLKKGRYKSGLGRDDAMVVLDLYPGTT